eukprot:m.465285 g.465285  ORF g.465285 m.465285 type:complete len:436 (+) comp24074_c0_seq1:180-1487(+)
MCVRLLAWVTLWAVAGRGGTDRLERQLQTTSAGPDTPHAAASPAPSAVGSISDTVVRVEMELELRQLVPVVGLPRVVIEVNRSLAPLGAERFLRLVELGFYNDSAIFRVAENFVVQWGISGNPLQNLAWDNADLPDEPVIGSNTVGTLAFATSGPNTRTTQVYVNLKDSPHLDAAGFTVFGRVASGLRVLQQLTRVNVDQEEYTREGNAFIERTYPHINYIVGAVVAAAYDDDPPPEIGPAVPTLPPTTDVQAAACVGSGAGSGSGEGGCTEAECSGGNLTAECSEWCGLCHPRPASCEDQACEGGCEMQQGVPVCLPPPTPLPTAAPTVTPTAAPSSAPTTAILEAKQKVEAGANAAASIAGLLGVVMLAMCLLSYYRVNYGSEVKYESVELSEELSAGWEGSDAEQALDEAPTPSRRKKKRRSSPRLTATTTL